MTDAPCPCDSGKPYAACCGPYHDGFAAPTAEALMRSRYSAYVLGREDYLLASWHATTRPASLGLSTQSPKPTWLGLSVKRHDNPTPDTAIVEFIASMRVGGGRAERMHEVSRFVREDGRWYYVDGDLS
ncbi:SEC-C motif-containing protein [Luteibacter sp. UNC138MFCol5.1]|uniref:YchJ family protein n=1 Tax=Luteibacter sp. UNC138MFCol5.1 TaxID=1502774 RepID=UPI0008D5978C|nr:YchJ family metal-binding protein [Luteibacter sp. UNC138MFCol5.1]SEO44033.1 SEC-C motif-containing protein [Luteibacter sp. UNC138MFCol5.1]